MPSQPPRYRPGGTAAPKAWARSSAAPDRRIRGRAGQRLRALVLSEEPFCRLCEEAGRVAASAKADHIVPLSAGGGNERSNFQGLCDPCHDAKTAEEAAAGREREAIGARPRAT